MNDNDNNQVESKEIAACVVTCFNIAMFVWLAVHVPPASVILFMCWMVLLKS